MSDNRQIEKYLETFLESSQKTSFATMFSGEWGSGKTYFVKNFFEKKRPDLKFIHISLYGIKSRSEVQSLLFQRRYPILSSKFVQILWKNLKSLIKHQHLLDFTEVQLEDFSKLKKNDILIFDDLERTELPINVALGIANYYSEVLGFRVIVITDETKLIHKNRNEKLKHPELPDYLEVKEKTIGRTFQILPSVENAVTYFLNHVHETKTQDFLRKNSSFICDIFTRSKYNNLRSLAQGIYEFSQIYKVLPSNAFLKDELLIDILRNTLVLNFEIRKSVLTIDDLASLSKLNPDQVLMKVHAENSKLKAIAEKYPPFSFNEIVPSVEVWYEFFNSGSLDKLKVEESINSSIYFLKDETVSWKKLWHYMGLRPQEFEALKILTEKDFVNGVFRRPQVIMHISGIFLALSSYNLFKKDLKDTAVWLSNTITDLYKKNMIDFSPHETSIRDSSWEGLAYHYRDKQEFLDIVLKLESLMRHSLWKKIPEMAKKTLEKLADNPRDVLLDFNSQDEFYVLLRRIPVFSGIDIGSLSDVIRNSSGEQIYYIGNVLKERFNHSDALVRSEEVPWLKRLEAELKRILEDSSIHGLIKRYILELLKEYIEPILKK